MSFDLFWHNLNFRVFRSLFIHYCKYVANLTIWERLCLKMLHYRPKAYITFTPISSNILLTSRKLMVSARIRLCETTVYFMIGLFCAIYRSHSYCKSKGIYKAIIQLWGAKKFFLCKSQNYCYDEIDNSITFVYI